MEIYFHLELGLLVCTTEYFNKIKNIFFNQYLNNSICELKYMTHNLNSYTMIVCADNTNFNIKSFPSLNFYHKELNLNFSLNYNDLFEKKNNKYYFLIIYSDFSGGYWKIGKPFLKKYQITLNLDSKEINFYDRNYVIDENTDDDNKKNNGIIKYYILIGVCCILFISLIITSYFFIKKLKGERKKRANELNDDEYEYVEEEDPKSGTYIDLMEKRNKDKLIN